MTTIIVPIDYSSVSKNAAYYALSMSKNLKEVQYVFYNTFYFVDIETVQATIERDAQDDMNAFVAEIEKDFPGVRYHKEVNSDFLIQGVSKLIEKHKADFIVMGITGKSNFTQRVIGSNTTTLAKELNIPVIVVPNNASYNGLSQMVLAIPYKNNLLDTVPYRQIEALVTALNIEVTVATVRKEKEASEEFVILMDQQNLLDKFKTMRPHYRVLDGTDVVAALQDYTQSSKANLIATVAESHGFWERILKRSVTDELALHAQVPLVIFKATDSATA